MVSMVPPPNGMAPSRLGTGWASFRLGSAFSTSFEQKLKLMKSDMLLFQSLTSKAAAQKYREWLKELLSQPPLIGTR